MLIKPFPHGKGNGREPTHYLVRQDYHGRKEHPPVVLRGDPDMTRRLIDSIDREWKFTAGVCSWGTGDAVTPEQEAHVMDDFEAVAFAGMQPDQYSILWVRHSHAGHHELHFVIPRMELSTGKAFNAFPPGWEKDFAPLRDLENPRYGWTRPDDPERARFCAPSQADIHEARLIRWGRNPTRNEKEKAREVINEYLKAKMEAGAVRDRADVLAALREAGLEINREGQDYISVKDPDSGEKIRLKGGVYGTEWKFENSGRTHEGEGRAGADRDGEGFQRTVADLEGQLAGVITKRAAYNVGRYGTGDYERGGEIERAVPGFELGVREEMDRAGDLGCGVVPGDAGGRVGIGEGRGVEVGELPRRSGTVEASLSGTAADLGEPEKRNVESGIAGVDERAFHRLSFREENGRAGMEGGRAGRDQGGGIEQHEQNRTGNNRAELSETSGRGSEGSPPDAGREDQEHRGAGGGLRAAVDAAVRICAEFAAACRRLEQYVVERRKTLERERERPPRGMSR